MESCVPGKLHFVAQRAEHHNLDVQVHVRFELYSNYVLTATFSNMRLEQYG